MTIGARGRPGRPHRSARDAPRSRQPGTSHRGAAGSRGAGRGMSEAAHPDDDARNASHVRGEHQYPVFPLGERDAVELRSPAQTKSDEGVSELCAALDRLPLAIELAAARSSLAPTPTQILERLSSRLDLSSGSRDADPRQRTLRAAIDWSHDLLSDGDKALFARLSGVRWWRHARCGRGSCRRRCGNTSVARRQAASFHKPRAASGCSSRFANTQTNDFWSSGERDATRARHAAWYRTFARAAAWTAAGRTSPKSEWSQRSKARSTTSGQLSTTAWRSAT